jgi:hypothetical protein
MNKLERIIYNTVRGNPALKRRVRNLYQQAFDLLPAATVKSNYPIVERQGYFFGFHDHSPFSADNAKLLANSAAFDLRMPSKEDRLKVGFFSGEDFKTFTEIGETRAWNWHMGSRLQWRGDFNQVVFNDHIGGENVARLIDIDSGQESVLSGAISSISPDGSWGIGYSFSRVESCMPGYGYIHDVCETDLEHYRPESTGLYLIDLTSGNKRELITIAQLAELNPSGSMKRAKHFFTHAQISPDSQRFMFLHRWINPDGDIDKRFSRLIVCALDGSVVDTFNTNEMVSHIGWRGSEQVIAFCRVPVFDDQYVLFTVGKPEETKILGVNCFSSDGHPSFDESGRWMLTDTYPDRRRVQTLALYDTQKEIRVDIAKLPMPKDFQSPSSSQHWACDLHPRWDRQSRFLCFDATFSGQRSLCTIDLGDDVKSDSLKDLSKTYNHGKEK